MAISTHNKYVSIPDWFSSSSSTPVTTVEKPTNVTNVYYGGGGGTTGITEIPIDNKTVVWLDLVITVPIDNDKIIINAEGKITTSDVYDTLKIWELRQLTDGTNYIYTTYPVVTQLGITMYAGTDGLNLGNIYDGLPIDGVTLYWSYDSEGNKILKSAGSVDGEGGVSDFWALHNIPSWITVSKPYYTTSEISEGNNLYFTNARAVSALAETLKYYVTLGDTQTITGEKNFTGGLKVNGSPIYYDTDKKYWKLEGDLLVTGGVTMYGSDSSFTPSTIMDAILYDSSTLGINSNGQLYVKGGTSGGGLDITALQNYLTQNSYLDVTSADNRYLKLSGGKIEGKLQIQRTPSNIAFYNADNVLWGHIGFNAANNAVIWDRSGANEYTIWHSGNDGSGSSLDADLLDGYHNGELSAKMLVLQAATSVVDSPTSLNGVQSFANLSGGSIGSIGTYDTVLSIGSAGRIFQIKGSKDSDIVQIRNASGNSGFRNWRSIAYLDANVASATKLQTARTIWGQSFDGMGNVSGDLSSTGHITSSKHATYDVGNNLTSYRYGYYQWVGSNSGATFALGANNEYHIHINTSGNVGIGTISPAYKLHVEGTMYGDLKMKTPRTIWGQSFDGTNDIKGTIRLSTSDQINGEMGLALNYNSGANVNTTIWNGNKTRIATFHSSGNVGIGTESPSSKLDVYNNTGTTVGLAIDGGLSAYGYLYNEIIIKHNGVFKASFGANSVASAYISGGAVGTYMNNGVSGEFISLLNEGGTYIKGNLLATGGITMYSDQRKKTILNHVELSLKQIANAPLIEHYYNGDEKKTTHVSSIAQYWANINNWFCKLDSEGFYTMEIQNAALASAISIARELDRYETKTDKAIKKLKKRICELEEEVERLKSA